MSRTTFIQDYPPCDRNEYECQCARCGSSCSDQRCFDCGGEGVNGHECGDDCCCCADPEENMLCETCQGKGHWWSCLSSSEWCESNPLPGRDQIKRGTIEWFSVETRQ